MSSDKENEEDARRVLLRFHGYSLKEIQYIYQWQDFYNKNYPDFDYVKNCLEKRRIIIT